MYRAIIAIACTVLLLVLVAGMRWDNSNQRRKDDRRWCRTLTLAIQPTPTGEYSKELHAAFQRLHREFGCSNAL